MRNCITALLKARGTATPTDLWLATLLIHMHDETTHATDASFAEIAAAFDCNERNAKRLIAALKKKGLLSVTRGKIWDGPVRNIYALRSCEVTKGFVYFSDSGSPQTVRSGTIGGDGAWPPDLPGVDAESQATYQGEADAIADNEMKRQDAMTDPDYPSDL